VFLDTAIREGLNSILIEGGQRLASAFLENGFVNKLYLFYGNKIFGAGKDGLAFSGGLPVDGCINLKGVTHQTFGDNILVTGYVK
jgi:diaminohydroxyphosphoribosylaminopyrimidine deaminase/5-amino-6-(5-phosphoribosylamino)uracil reductase